MKIGFLALSGVRCHNRELMELGLNLPGFVERSKVIASLPSLGLLTLAGFAEHSTVGGALVAPAAFVVLNVIEGQWLTPLLVGRRLQLDPIAIVMALLVFGWLWGFAGVLLAVPLLAASRIVASVSPL